MRTLPVIVAGFCAFLQVYATQPLLPLLARLFGAGEVTTSLTITMGSVGVAVSAPFVGRLADRLGRKPVIVWSAFLLALTTLAASTSPTLPVLIFWRFCQGLCTPGVFAVTVAYINDEWPPGKVGSALASYISGTVMGGFSSRFLAGLVVDRLGWQGVFIVLGLVSLAGAIAIALLLPPEKKAHGSATGGSIFKATAAHLENRLLLGTYAVGFCILFTQVAAFTYVTFYLAAPPFNLEPFQLGLIFLVYPIAAAVNLIAGRAIDRYGQRWALVCGFGVGVCGILLTLIPNLWAVGTGLAACSIGVFVAQTSANGVVGIAAKDHRALAVGLYATFYYLGGSAGGALPGLFWNLGGWAACAIFIATVQVLTIGMALSFWSGVDVPRAQPAS